VSDKCEDKLKLLSKAAEDRTDWWLIHSFSAYQAATQKTEVSSFKFW